MADEMYIFTRSYLEWVIQEYGPAHPVMSSNCAGKPIKPEDYVIVYGTAKEILDLMDQQP